MKKILIYIISVLITMGIFAISGKIIKNIKAPKDIYTLSSQFTISNKKNVLKEGNIDYYSCLNKNGDFFINITILNEEIKSVDYEISIIINGKQCSFHVNDDSDYFLSKVISVCNGEKSISVIVDKSYFKTNENDCIIFVRQDVKEKCCDNHFVCESSTLKFRYNIVLSDYSSDIEDYEVLRLIKEKSIDCIDGIQIGLSNANETNDLISINANEVLNLDMNIQSEFDETGYLIAFVDSKQVLINNQEKILINLKKGYEHYAKLNFEVPFVKDIHEIEMFFIKKNPDEREYNQNSIISSNKFSIEVKNNV